MKTTGAILEDMPADDEVSSMKFAGSTIVIVAESRQAVMDVLKEDVYVKSGVWDLEKVSFSPVWWCGVVWRVAWFEVANLNVR